MARNIEIKAHATDFSSQIKIAESLCGSEPEVIHQEDVFFNVSSGKLKLRIFSPDRAELIFYNRPNQHGPKMSRYEISPTNDPEGLKSILKNAYGIRSTVVKTRLLFMSGRTRIHFDNVESLGEFIELEVVLSKSEDPDGGENEAQELMDLLGVKEEHLVEVAYVDLLDPKNA